jgi:hypothetical protein
MLQCAESLPGDGTWRNEALASVVYVSADCLNRAESHFCDTLLKLGCRGGNDSAGCAVRRPSSGDADLVVVVSLERVSSIPAAAET